MTYKPPRRFNVTVYTDRGVEREIMRCGTSTFAITAFLNTRPPGWAQNHFIADIHCEWIPDD